MIIKLQRVRAMARKEWWHLLRDPTSLALVLLMPGMLLFLFGYAIRLDLYEAPIAIVQESRNDCASELAARFTASSVFKVQLRSADRREVIKALQAGVIWAALIIPNDYDCALGSKANHVQWLIDGVDANTARLLRNYALMLVENYSLEQVPGTVIRIEERTWFNETRESRIAIIPGIIAIVMAVIGTLMTSLTAAREIEQGTLVMLRTTPVTRSEFLLGKLFPYFCIGLLNLTVALIVVLFIFQIPLRGSLISFILVSALFIAVVMLQGALISMAAGNQLLASQMALVSTFLPAFLLSGFIFAIENMPKLVSYLTFLIPARYHVALAKAIFIKGISPLLLWGQILALLLMLLILTGVALVKAKKLGLP